MKKRYLLTASLAALALASCSSTPTEDLLTDRRDDISDAVKTEYKLDTLTKQLNEVDETSKDYYKIFVSENVIDTLFVDIRSINDVYEKYGDRVETISAPVIAFNTTMYATENTPVLNTIYSEKGLASLNDEDGKLAGFVQDLTLAYEKKVNVKDAYADYNAEKNVLLKAVYLPLKIERVNSSTKVLTTYLLMPVYVTVTSEASPEVDSLPTKTFDYKSEEDILAEVKSGVAEDDVQAALNDKAFYLSDGVRMIKNK